MRWESPGKASLKAVGLLGSDVCDKLELLKALRPMLPEAVFFTKALKTFVTSSDLGALGVTFFHLLRFLRAVAATYRARAEYTCV